MADLSAFDDGSADYAICLYQSLGYVPDKAKRQRVVDHVFRVLRPNGKAIFDVYNILHDLVCPAYWGFLLKTSLGIRDADLEFGDVIAPEVSEVLTYTHLFTPAELRGYFEEAGFLKLSLEFVSRESGEVDGSLFRSIRNLGMSLVAEKTEQ